MRVVPPPPPVPRLMVVNSRITLPSPISSPTRSPPYFLSCGSPPIAAWPWMRLPRPMRVGPWMLQCGPTWVPSPISTPGPTTVNGPISTPLPIRADGSTTALAWMDASATSGLDLGAEDVGAGDLLAVDAGRAAVLGHVADLALDRDLEVEAVAGDHHARELGVVDLDQVRQPAFRAAPAGELGEDAAGLGQRLDHQHARHHRLVREVALEERLVGADVLVAEHALARFELDHAVDQQERIAVRQHPPDFGDVDRHGHGCGHQSSLSRGVFS